MVVSSLSLSLSFSLYLILLLLSYSLTLSTYCNTYYNNTYCKDRERKRKKRGTMYPQKKENERGRFPLCVFLCVLLLCDGGPACWSPPSFPLPFPFTARERSDLGPDSLPFPLIPLSWLEIAESFAIRNCLVLSDLRNSFAICSKII